MYVCFFSRMCNAQRSDIYIKSQRSYFLPKVHVKRPCFEYKTTTIMHHYLRTTAGACPIKERSYYGNMVYYRNSKRESIECKEKIYAFISAITLTGWIIWLSTHI